VSFWTSARVAEVLGIRHPGAVTFTRVSTDTRALRGGELFVALKGERFDAHAFLAEARARGAGGAVVARGTAAVPGLPVFEGAARWRGRGGARCRRGPRLSRSPARAARPAPKS
jgi:UDP-N-acetylmuramyl pentapeptide synthase